MMTLAGRKDPSPVANANRKWSNKGPLKAPPRISVLARGLEQREAAVSASFDDAVALGQEV
jgi:hypothetical protein